MSKNNIYLPVQIELQTLLENNLIAGKDVGFITSLAYRTDIVGRGLLSEAQEWWAKHFVNNFVPGSYTLGPRPQRKGKAPKIEVTQYQQDEEDFLKTLEDYLTEGQTVIADPKNKTIIDIISKEMMMSGWDVDQMITNSNTSSHTS